MQLERAISKAAVERDTYAKVLRQRKKENVALQAKLDQFDDDKVRSGDSYPSLTLNPKP